MVAGPRPVEAIADRTKGDLIVMCTHGRGGFARTLFGSVADEVVRSAHGPVLVIPPVRAPRTKRRPQRALQPQM